MRMWVSGALVATNSCAVLLIKVVQVPGIPWQAQQMKHSRTNACFLGVQAALDILCKVREDRLQEDASPTDERCAAGTAKSTSPRPLSLPRWPSLDSGRQHDARATWSH